ADDAVAERPGRGDPAGGARRVGVLVEVGEAAEAPQLDRRRLDAEAPRSERVGELVQEDGDEEAEHAGGGQQEVEILGEEEAEQTGDHERGPVHPDGRAEVSADGERTAQHRDPPRVYRAAAPSGAVQPVVASTTVAQLRPLAPQMPAPGNVAAPVRNSPGTAVW